MTLHKRQGSKYRRATHADVESWLKQRGYDKPRKMTREGDGYVGPGERLEVVTLGRYVQDQHGRRLIVREAR